MHTAQRSGSDRGLRASRALKEGPKALGTWHAGSFCNLPAHRVKER